MRKLTKFISVLCAMTLIFSLPSSGFAGFQEMMEELKKKEATGKEELESRTKRQEKMLEAKKSDLNELDKKIEALEKKIDDLIKKKEKAKSEEEIRLAVESANKELSGEKNSLKSCRDVLDELTSFMLKDDHSEKDEDLVLSTRVAQTSFEDASKRVDELEKRLEQLRIEQNDSKNFETDLKILSEEKIKYENERSLIQKELEKIQKRLDELFVEKLEFEENMENEKYLLECLNTKNQRIFDKWNRINAGDQNKDNVLDGQNIGLTCGIFAATNGINYFNCGKPIQGFKAVINNFLNYGGKKENLNKILSAEELTEYITNNGINMYTLAYEEDVSNISDLKVETEKQKANVKEFLIAHFQGVNQAPVLNLNRGHWQAFTAYDEINQKVLLVDSSPARAEWVDLDCAAGNSVAISQNKLNWQWIFLAENKQTNSDFFGKGLVNVLTEEKKQQIIKFLKEDF